MIVKQFDVWIADLNPRIGTEAGKTRPVVVIQTNLLNKVPHPSTIICPITSQVQPDAEILRVHLLKGTAGLLQDCDVMVDQLRAIDNVRLVQRIGTLSADSIRKITENIKITLDLD